MAIEFDIQVRNGAIKIIVGGGQTSGASTAHAGGNSPGNSGGHTGGGGGQGGSNSGSHGANSPGNSGGHTGGGGPGSGSGCCGPVVIGPIIIDASSMQSSQSGQGGNSPGNTGGHTGGQEAAGPRGGNSPANSGGHTGGDGPGSGCCCPVVIGPIVISNCCSSSADPSGDPPDPPAQQISLIPPADVEATPRARAFLMQNQGESDWCWAAVAVSINNFLDPQPNATTVGAAPTWTQGQLATQLLAQEMQWDPPVDCSVDPNLRCDKTAALDVALTITKNLMDGGAKFNEYLDFASIQKWLDLQLPIGARIVWPNGGAHFIALSGYQTFANGEQKVMVEDPLYGTSLQDYSSLLGQYVHYGTWQDTYLVQP